MKEPGLQEACKSAGRSGSAGEEEPVSAAARKP
jgi:hypothetical protein